MSSEQGVTAADGPHRSARRAGRVPMRTAVRRLARRIARVTSFARARPLNLALQGGGAHGAFTWGVLDRLLEQGHFRLDGVSGTSAGAVNAVALAAGLMEDGPDGARAMLEDVWRAIATSAAPGNALSARLPAGWSGLSRTWSPYQFNPLDINPLRHILRDRIDFERLREGSPVRLFLAATEVSSGRARIFRTEEVTEDCVLASTCLPNLFPAIKIGRHHYWDGGFSANPDLITLISETSTDDTLLVQLTPQREPSLPTTADEIAGNVNRIMFNQPLRREIEVIERSRRAAGPLPGFRGKTQRLREHRFHLIEADRHTSQLDEQSKMLPDWDLLVRLHAAGREEAEHWLEAHRAAVGRDSSVDLYDRFFESRLPFD
ncbi:MAG: patatin-like phospholipase family protein [Hyphomicrobiales bacterium]|nr:patatin-like phospholipase family protein [Hyphomicrobiales bacterium]